MRVPTEIHFFINVKHKLPRHDDWVPRPVSGHPRVQMEGRTENLLILQDFVSYRGRCLATAQLQPKNCIKRGKDTADHMMPFGDWLLL